MRHPKGKKYCSTDEALQQYCYSLKSRQCPHCGITGFLVCHGFLKGYSVTGQKQVVRGRRFLCSNRFQRVGCGRTFSVLLSEFIRDFMVTTGILWRLLMVVKEGQTVSESWKEIAPEFCVESGHRLWRRLWKSQSSLKTRLNRERPPPDRQTDDPMLQMAAHFKTVFPLSPCPFAQYQSTFQESLL